MTRLQELRISAGLSQSQLAKKAGISVRALQAYESNNKQTGGRSFDSARLKTILKVCVALDCSISDIVEDSEIKALLQIANNKKRGSN